MVINFSANYDTDPRATVLIDGPNIADQNPNDNSQLAFRQGNQTVSSQTLYDWMLAGLYDNTGCQNNQNGPRRLTRMVMPDPEYSNAFMTIDGRELLPVNAGINNINHFVVQSSLAMRGYINGVYKKVVFTGNPQKYMVAVYRGGTRSYSFPNYFFKNEAQTNYYRRLMRDYGFYHDYQTIGIINSADMVPNVKVQKVYFPLNP